MNFEQFLNEAASDSDFYTIRVEEDQLYSEYPTSNAVGVQLTLSSMLGADIKKFGVGVEKTRTAWLLYLNATEIAVRDLLIDLDDENADKPSAFKASPKDTFKKQTKECTFTFTADSGEVTAQLSRHIDRVLKKEGVDPRFFFVTKMTKVGDKYKVIARTSVSRDLSSVLAS